MMIRSFDQGDGFLVGGTGDRGVLIYQGEGGGEGLTIEALRLDRGGCLFSLLRIICLLRRDELPTARHTAVCVVEVNSTCRLFAFLLRCIIRCFCFITLLVVV